jgi:hypothetical protein
MVSSSLFFAPEMYDKENAESFSYASYREEVDSWLKGLSDENFEEVYDSFSSLYDSLGVMAAGKYISVLKEGTVEFNEF